MLALLLAACTLQDPAAEAAPAPPPLAQGTALAWRGGAATEQEFNAWLVRFLGLADPEVDAALRHLLQIQLVETEASARGWTASAAEVDARLAQAQEALTAAGLELERELRSRGMTLAEFRKLLGDSLLHERLARADLGLEPDAAVNAQQLQAWSAARSDAILAANRPAGDLALDSGPYRAAWREVGATLVRTISARRLRDFAGQYALEQALPIWGESAGLALTDEVLLAELEWRRQRVAENPNYHGATYEGLLAARGSSVEAVLAGSEIRVAGWLRLYSRHLWPDAWFEALDADARAALDLEFGATREVSWLLLHAKPVKDDPELDLTPAEAAEELQRYREQMRGPEDFGRLAEKFSEHDASRRRRGLYGSIHRHEPGADPLLCAAAFELPIGEISAPQPVSGGMALILVHGERRAPTEPELREAARRARHDEAREQFVAGLQLRTIWDEAAQ